MKRVLLIALMFVIGFAVAVGWHFRLIEFHPIKQIADQPKVGSIAPTVEEALFRGDLAAQQPIAAKVIQDIKQGIKPEQFKTGNPRFDGEWTIGTYQMAVMGLGQIILAHPEVRSTYLPVIEQLVKIIAPY